MNRLWKQQQTFNRIYLLAFSLTKCRYCERKKKLATWGRRTVKAILDLTCAKILNDMSKWRSAKLLYSTFLKKALKCWMKLSSSCLNTFFKGKRMFSHVWRLIWIPGYLERRANQSLKERINRGRVFMLAENKNSF